jgi:hypothetical protein
LPFWKRRNWRRTDPDSGKILTGQRKISKKSWPPAKIRLLLPKSEGFTTGKAPIHGKSTRREAARSTFCRNDSSTKGE